MSRDPWLRRAQRAAGPLSLCLGLAVCGAAARAEPSPHFDVEATASSNLGHVFFVGPRTPGVLDIFDDGCATGICGAAHAFGANGSLGLDVRESGSFGSQPGSIRAGIIGYGTMIITGGVDAPAFIDTELRLHFAGAVTGSHLQGSAAAAVGLSATIGGLVGAGGSGSYRATYGFNTPVAPPTAQNMHAESGVTLVLEHLHLPVNTVFELALGLGAEVSTIGEATVDVDYLHTAGMARNGLLMRLPDGLSLESADWQIVHNRFCPAPCQATDLPAPASMPLAAVALLGLGLARTRRPGAARPA